MCAAVTPIGTGTLTPTWVGFCGMPYGFWRRRCRVDHVEWGPAQCSCLYHLFAVVPMVVTLSTCCGVSQV